MMIRKILPVIAFAFADVACARTLEVGETGPAKASETATILTTYEKTPEGPAFTPYTLALVGDALYVGGELWTNVQSNEWGRIFRVSIDRGDVREVWRGPGLR